MEVSGWKEIDGQFVCEFVFDDQTSAAQFVLQVAKMSDETNHHAEILLHSWNRVRLSICTHDEGNSITEKDYLWSSKVDEIIAN